MKYNYKLTSVIIIAMVPFLFVIFSGIDLWDGVIISHAFETNSPDIYRDWFDESGWFLTPILYDIFYFTSNGEYSFYSMKLFMVLCHFASGYYIYLICYKKFNLSENAAVLALIFFLLSPIWNIYYSTVFLMHSFTLMLALVSVYYMLNYNKKHFASWGALSFLSFQQASCPPLIISILIFDLLKGFSKKKITFFSLYILVSVLFFFSTSKLFPANGLYVGYNDIDLSKLLNWVSYREFFRYLFYVYPLLLISTIIIYLTDKNKRLLLIGMLGMFLINILPFVLVGKTAWHTHLNIIGGWEQRQAITITVSAAIWIAFLIPHKKNTLSNFISALIIFASISVLAYRTYHSFLIKEKSVFVKENLVSILKKRADDFEGCGFVLFTSLPPEYRIMSTYELNYITWKSFNGRRYSFLDDNGAYKIFEQTKYRNKYIQPDKVSSCMKKAIYSINIEELDYTDLIFSKNIIQELSISDKLK